MDYRGIFKICLAKCHFLKAFIFHPMKLKVGTGGNHSVIISNFENAIRIGFDTKNLCQNSVKVQLLPSQHYYINHLIECITYESACVTFPSES